MEKYPIEQVVANINGTNLGGQPGERPTVLIGSPFFRGHQIVSDHRKGIFNKNKARALLVMDAEMSAQTGNPNIIDIIADTGEALIRYIDFVAEHTTAPILVDSASSAARLEAMRHYAGSALMPRLIYISIDEHCTEAELDGLQDCGVQNAVTFTLPVSYEASFIFYGPMRNAPWAYPACAAMDAMIASAARNYKVRPLTREHPLYRIF